jgi:hypothetical protein
MSLSRNTTMKMIRIQPIGLRGWRRAIRKPTAA